MLRMAKHGFLHLSYTFSEIQANDLLSPWKPGYMEYIYMSPSGWQRPVYGATVCGVILAFGSLFLAPMHLTPTVSSLSQK